MSFRVIICVFCYLLIGSYIAVHGQILHKNSNEKILNLNNFKGSKYINDNFTKATVKDGLTNKDKELFLRYDTYNDVFETKNSLSENTFGHLKKSIEIKVIYNQKIFLYKNYINSDGIKTWGYLKKICEIENTTFYQKLDKTIIMPVKAKTSLEKDKPGKIRDKKYYVLGTQDNLKATNINKKTIFKYIPQHKVKDAKEYIKKSKLKFKEANDLKKLCDYLNLVIQ